MCVRSAACLVSRFPQFLHFSVFRFLVFYVSLFLTFLLFCVSVFPKLPRFLMFVFSHSCPIPSVSWFGVSAVSPFLRFSFLGFYVSLVSTFLVFCVFVFSKLLCFSHLVPFSFVSFPQCLLRRSFRRFSISPFLVFSVYIFSAFLVFYVFDVLRNVSFFLMFVLFH